MNNLHSYITILLGLLLTQLTLVSGVSAQEMTLQIGSFNYGQSEGRWYQYVDGRRADPVETSRIMLRLRDQGEIDEFPFENFGLPRLKTVLSRYGTGFYSVTVPQDRDPFVLAKLLERTGLFDFVKFPAIGSSTGASNDSYLNNQWGLSKIEASRAWDITTGSPSVIVAVLDTGTDYTHPDLNGNIWTGVGKDFYQDDSDPMPVVTELHPDGDAHGTNVAGVIAAETNNGVGVSGVAGGWNGAGGARIMVLRVGQGGLILEDVVASAIYYARDNGAKIINMSFIFQSGYLASVADALEDAAGVVSIASSGNGNSDTVSYPASAAFVISVGASDETDHRWVDGQFQNLGSNYGSGLDLVAPGGPRTIVTTDLQGLDGLNYAWLKLKGIGSFPYPDPVVSTAQNYTSLFSGTSAAAPFVSGVAALVLSINPNLAPGQVASILTGSAEQSGCIPQGSDRLAECGAGRVNAYKALKKTIEEYGATLTQNLVIPAGETWNLGAVTLTFAPGTQLTVNGTLNATGTIFKTASSSWSGIYFASGSGGTLDGVKVQNVQAYGGAAIYINGTSPSIKNSTIENCSGACNGIYVNGGSPFLFHNTITGNSAHGVYLSNSNANLIQNNITGNTTVGNAAVYTTNYATPLFAAATSPYFEGRNTMKSAYYGVYATNGASPDVGVSSSLAYNNRFASNTYDAVATTGSDILAKYVWWGEYPINMGQISGSVNKDNALTSDPGAAFKTGIPPDDNDLSELYIQAKEHRYNEAYGNAISLFKQILAAGRKDREARLALVELSLIQRHTKDQALLAFLKQQVEQQGDTLRPTVLEILLNCYLEEHNENEAHRIIQTLIEEYPGTVHEKNARLAQFFYWVSRKELDLARQAIGPLTARFAEDPDLMAAQWLLYLEGVEATSGQQAWPLEDAGVVEQHGIQVQVFPNPFNPQTTIRYTLPVEGHATVRVYDVMGRELAVLVDALQQAGTYESRFDASHLASGLYLYRIDAMGRSLTGKMLLMK